MSMDIRDEYAAREADPTTFEGDGASGYDVIEIPDFGAVMDRMILVDELRAMDPVARVRKCADVMAACRMRGREPQNRDDLRVVAGCLESTAKGLFKALRKAR